MPRSWRFKRRFNRACTCCVAQQIAFDLRTKHILCSNLHFLARGKYTSRREKKTLLMHNVDASAGCRHPCKDGFCTGSTLVVAAGIQLASAHTHTHTHTHITESHLQPTPLVYAHVTESEYTSATDTASVRTHITESECAFATGTASLRMRQYDVIQSGAAFFPLFTRFPC